MIIKEQIKHGAIQKVCHLHNGIFNPIQLCHTLSILLYHFLFIIHYFYIYIYIDSLNSFNFPELQKLQKVTF